MKNRAEFTCECWIENTSEHLVKALDNMGRSFDNLPYPWNYWLHDCKYLYSSNNGTYSGTCFLPKFGYKCDNTVQFLVLSNMRDDTDMMQWFWYNHPCNGEQLFQCTSMRQAYCIAKYPGCYRRATPENLLERFK